MSNALRTSKRTNPVKVMLTDEELLDVQRQALAQDLSPGEIVRKNCMAFMWGILGTADRRRQRNRGADEELIGADFHDSAFIDGTPREPRARRRQGIDTY
jgi:hypothetical protein